MRAASRKPRVSSLSVRLSDIDVGAARAMCRGRPAARSASVRGVRFQAITFMPMPLAMRATSAPMPPSPMMPSVLPSNCMPSQRLPGAGAYLAIHAREVAAAGKHQRDGVLGHRGVAVALDGVNRDAEVFELGDVHVARGAGAEKHDVLEGPHCRTRSVGM